MLRVCVTFSDVHCTFTSLKITTLHVETLLIIPARFSLAKSRNLYTKILRRQIVAAIFSPRVSHHFRRGTFVSFSLIQRCVQRCEECKYGEKDTCEKKKKPQALPHESTIPRSQSLDSRRARCFHLRPSYYYIIFHINWPKHRKPSSPANNSFDHPRSRHFAMCFRLPYFCFVNRLAPRSAYGPPMTSASPSTHVSLTSLMLVRQVLFVTPLRSSPPSLPVSSSSQRALF